MTGQNKTWLMTGLCIKETSIYNTTVHLQVDRMFCCTNKSKRVIPLLSSWWELHLPVELSFKSIIQASQLFGLESGTSVFSITLLKVCHEGLRQFWKQREVQLGTKKGCICVTRRCLVFLFDTALFWWFQTNYLIFINYIIMSRMAFHGLWMFENVSVI